VSRAKLLDEGRTPARQCPRQHAHAPHAWVSFDFGAAWCSGRDTLFDSNVLLMSPGCLCPFGDSVSVFGHSGEDRRKATLERYAITSADKPRKALELADARSLMGVEWMRRREDVSDAIPPVYTEYLGAQLLDHLAERAA